MTIRIAQPTLHRVLLCDSLCSSCLPAGRQVTKKCWNTKETKSHEGHKVK